MTLTVDLTYPKDLTNAHWQKAKGNISKLAGKTGVGEALDKAEKAWKDVKWELFDARMNGKLHSVEEVDALLDKAKAEWPKVEKVRKALRDAEKLAEDCAKKFKSNKLIPASSTKAAEGIAKDCDRLAVALKSFDTKDFDAMKAKLEAQVAMERKKIKESVVNLEKALIAGLKEPTYEFWDNNIKQRFRSVGNALGVIPELKAKFWSTWKDYDGFQHEKVKAKGAPDEQDKMKTLIMKMGKELQELKKAVA